MSKIIAANWKMNKGCQEAEDAAKKIEAAVSAGSVLADRTLMIFPPFVSLAVVAKHVSHCSRTFVGAQNFYPKESGAFTGEISLPMIAESGAKWVLVGHSERRHILGESDAFIAEKTRYALEHDFGVMLCIGETLEERESGHLRDVFVRQLETALLPLKTLPKATLQTSLMIAYEPVWAIGTGKVAGEAEVLDAHKVVKEILRFDGFDLSSLPVLYGGSVKPANASQLLSLANVDGLLIGGASLDPDSFLKIANA